MLLTNFKVGVSVKAENGVASGGFKLLFIAVATFSSGSVCA